MVEHMAPANAEMVTGTIWGPNSKMAADAPKAAPWLMPNVKGELNGFLISVCMPMPDRESPQPAMMADTIRGRRIFQTTMSAGPTNDPVSTPNKSLKVI